MLVETKLGFLKMTKMWLVTLEVITQMNVLCLYATASEAWPANICIGISLPEIKISETHGYEIHCKT